MVGVVFVYGDRARDRNYFGTGYTRISLRRNGMQLIVRVVFDSQIRIPYSLKGMSNT
jgi:hypothetical protein